ncbi:heterokaryon incompatibility protein-domain-containing protein [Mariannaea sp. PMI_226]|nr:heterokaryon incompatibility protein-domain-containing protein [Mariannaea sp. PMI_226]
MALCEYCRNIPAKLFSFRRNDQCDYDHHPSLNALKGSATAAGCQGCRLFLHAIESSTAQHAGKYALAKTWSVDEPVRLSSTKFGWQMVRVGWKEAGHFRTFDVPSDWRGESPPGFTERAEDSTADMLYESELIKRWSSHCLESHNCFAKPEDTRFLPTRLIDVGTTAEPTLRLIRSTEIQSPNRLYLALSHCWGLAMPDAARTVSLTLNSHMISIPAGTLPKTFQDFIDIARRLEIQYVWIDSLCIIQDSREDWEKEAAQMAQVYSTAHLTIAASGSADGRGGCHVEGNVRSYGPVDIECPLDDSTSEKEDLTKTFRLWSRDTYPVGQILTADPLMKRGWTLQERELAPRIVHYSKDTIRWECREQRATIEFPWGDPASFDVGRLFDGGSSARPTTFGLPASDPSKMEDATKQSLSWFELVSRYTNRSLTKQTDVLLALSGIARSIAASTSDEYCAGLWKSYFAHCLLWASDWHMSRGLKQHTRPANYLAPSWSWASVKGPIQYLSWVNGYSFTYNADPDPAYVPRLIDVSLQASTDQYGILLGGALQIEGKFGVAFSRQEAYAMPKDHTNTTFSDGPQDRLTLFGMSASRTVEKVGEIRYDVPLCSECAPVGTMKPVFLLCCMNSKKSPDGTMRTFAIALEGADTPEEGQQLPSGAPSQYRRVGVAWGIDPSFWTRGVTATITIV